MTARLSFDAGAGRHIDDSPFPVLRLEQSSRAAVTQITATSARMLGTGKEQKTRLRRDLFMREQTLQPLHQSIVDGAPGAPAHLAGKFWIEPGNLSSSNPGGALPNR